VTVVTPIIPDRLEALRRCLHRIETEARSPGGKGSPFERVEGTHFARWVILDQLVNEKLSRAPLDADPPQLLFGAVGDGKPREFLQRLCEPREGLPAYAREVWTKHCEAADATDLCGYLHKNRLRGGLLYGGYRATPEVIEAALADAEARGV
jgi:hypothetical protein